MCEEIKNKWKQITTWMEMEKGVEGLKIGFENGAKRRENLSKRFYTVYKEERSKKMTKNESFLLQEIGIFLLLLDILLFRIYFHPSLELLLKWVRTLSPLIKIGLRSSK